MSNERSLAAHRVSKETDAKGEELRRGGDGDPHTVG